MSDEAPRFDTKIVIVLREDLPAWQKLNVCAFLMSGIVSQCPSIIGGPYVDRDGKVFNALSCQPVICMAADSATLLAIHQRAVAAGVRASAYVEEMFATGHDAANRAEFARFGAADAKVVGLALRESRKLVDKIAKGARMHPA